MVFDQQFKNNHSHRRFRVNRKYSMCWGSPHSEVCYTRQGKKPRGQKRLLTITDYCWLLHTITMQCLLTVLGLLYTPFYMKKSLETLSILGNFSLNVGGTEATMVLSFSNHLTQEAMGNTGLTHVGKVSKVSQSCPTLCDPTDCSLPCSSIRGIFRARVLKWGAIAFSM